MQITGTTERQVESPRQDHDGHGRSPFSQLLDEFDYPKPQRGDILQGEILRIEEDVLFVDVGSKRDAMVPHDEVSQLDETLLQNLSQGDEVPVYVKRTPIDDEHLLVSLERGLQQLDWEEAQALQAKDETVELKVVNYNKGGLTVAFNAIQGFVPNSHIPEFRRIQNRNERQQFKAKQIGKTRLLKIIEVDSRQHRLVFSATAVQKEQRQQKLQSLTPGEVVAGKVIAIKKYGAFVDIGQDLVGLLHISKIDWQHIAHPSEILSVGEEIELMVDDIDVARERLSLNRKALMPDPWQQFAQNNEVGDLVEGEVTTVVDFGAFVMLAAGIEGLLHQNEINIPPEGETADVLQPGDAVVMRIIKIEPGRKRLGLSMRRVSAGEESAWLFKKHKAEVNDQISDTHRDDEII